MRSLACQWQRVTKPGIPLEYLSVDPDTNFVYGCYGNTVVKIDYDTPQVLLYHELDKEVYLTNIHYLPACRALSVVINDKVLGLFHPDTKTLEEVVDVEDGIATLKWSPDDGICVIVTCTGKLLLMNEEFDCISEACVRPEGFGTEQQTQVGWGSKDTQFHGTEGKSAAQKPVFATPTPISNDDHQVPVVSWRGDGQYFSVSTVDTLLEQKYRVIRMWTRDCVHTATNEPIPGLEEALCWRPSGNLVTSTATAAGRQQVIFMERNGLRHGEFPLSLHLPNTVVSETLWNAGSNVLAVVYDGKDQSHVMLYTCTNYSWQLKQHLTFGEMVTFEWDPEKELRFHIATGERYICYQYTWSVLKCSSTTVMVLDDKKVLVTPLGKMCLPPPMSHSQLCTSASTNSVGVLGDDVWCVCSDRTLQRFSKISSLAGPVEPVEVYEVEKEFPLPSHVLLRHLVMLSEDKAMCIALVNDTDALLTLELADKEVFIVSCTTLEDTVVNMVQRGDVIAVQLYSGELFQLVDGLLEPWGNQDMRECVQFCEAEIVIFEDEAVVLGRTEQNHVYIDTRIWSHDCTSFAVHKTHILLTSNTHTLKCVSLNQSAHIARTTEGVLDTGIRALERGSRLVVSDPSTSRVILQMPRGNLELIHPRPLLLTHLCHLISNKKYDTVFIDMRVHRVNMNFVYDYDPEQFLTNIPLILSLISSSQLELFLTELSEEDTMQTMYSFVNAVSDSPPGKVTNLCQTLIAQCDVTKWSNAITCCYVKMNQIREGLLCLKSLHTTHPEVAEDSIKLMLIMTDDNTLFNEALSTYDLDLVLQVAQFTQKDPKEYLIFLNELKGLEEDYRKYKIDRHLGNNKLALISLVKCEKFGEVIDFVTQHELYSQGLSCYPPSCEQFRTLSNLFAGVVKQKGKLSEAGLLYAESGQFKESLECLRNTTLSSIAISLAHKLDLGKDEMCRLCEQLAANLKQEGNYLGAARLLEKYCANVEEAVEVLTEGSLFSEALEVALSRPDLIEKVTEALVQCGEGTLTLLNEKIQSVSKFTERLIVVRERKLASGEIEDMEHSDLYSDTTSITATSHASSNASKRSSKSSKGRRKHERKKYSLKEGSKFESYALQEAYKEIVMFLNEQNKLIKDMVSVLIMQGYRGLAQNISQKLNLCIQQTNLRLSEVWPKPATVPEDEEMAEEEPEPVSTAPDIKLYAWTFEEFTV